jgi:serine/threonine-protein kinase RsbT
VSGAPSRVRIPIREEIDVAMARKHVRELAARQGLSEAAAHSLATATSEIARNIVVHAGAGEIVLDVEHGSGQRGILVVARDAGPGIPDLEQAMEDGYSTGNGLGLGLPGARRLVDEFELISVVDRGTTVVLRMWVR